MTNPQKEITVKLFDDKRDFITNDCIYWASKNTLFPFDSSLITQKNYEVKEQIESILSLHNDIDKTAILSKLLKKELDFELSNSVTDDPYFNDEVLSNV